MWVSDICFYFIFFFQNTLEGDGKLHVLFLFFVALMFCISLWSLFGYHLYLIGNNKTTLGKLRKPLLLHKFFVLYLPSSVNCIRGIFFNKEFGLWSWNCRIFFGHKVHSDVVRSTSNFLP